MPVTVLVADDYPNFSTCGLPFALSGETSRWADLAHRSVEELADAGVDGEETLTFDCDAPVISTPTAAMRHTRRPPGMARRPASAAIVELG